MGGPAVVAGRIPPAEWEPQTGPEQAACYNDALALLVRGLTDDREPVRERAAELLVDNLRFLLADRWFEVAQIVGERNDVRSAFLPRILDQIDDFIRYDSERWDEQYISAVKLWRESLVPRGDRLAQLRAIVGQSRKWGEDPNAEQELQRLIVDLARQLVDDQSFFEKSLDWLSSKEANYAFEVGEQLGRLDLDLRLFQRIKAKAQRDDASLVRGYIFGAVEQHHSLPSSIADWLGELEADEPQLLYRIASSIPTQVQGLDRVLRLVAAGKLPPRFLNGMQYRFGGEGLSIQQLVDVLGVLSSYEGKDREEALITAIDIAASQVNKRNIQHQGETVLNDQVWPLIRSVVANAMPKATMDVFHWSSLMRAIEAKDPLLVTSKAVQALAEGIYTGERATEILLQVAKNSSELVMTQLGKALLNEKTGWRLQIHGFGALLSNLPVEVVLAWLDRHGVIAARKIASNLPVPFVSDSGEPILPPLTERVLKRYGDDEEVRQRFISRSGVRSYSGDIVGQHLREADVAAQFLNHPLEPIRYWARVEQQRSLGEAARWKQHVEEERW